MTKSPIYLSVKDHSVSGETFQLRLNEEHQLLKTQPRPDDTELAKYYKSEDYISHTDSKRNLFEHLYHIIRSIALKQKLKLVNSLESSKKTILDIGCGTGDFLQTVQKDGWEVYGIEPNGPARNIANNKTNNSVFETARLKELQDKNFEVITLWHVLEHLSDLDKQIRELKRLLEKDGRLVIAVPNFKSHDAEHYKEHWAAFDVPRHLWHFSKESISKLFLDVHMEVEKILPMKFDAYYVSMLSEKYKKSSFGFIRGIYRGWISNRKASRSGEYSSLIYVLKNQK